MDRLWSPWRMAYIEAQKSGEVDAEGCVFCAQLDGRLEDQPPPLLVEELVFVTLAKYPYNPGHLLVLPVRHVGDLDDLTDEEGERIHRLLGRCVRVVRDASDPHGFNIGLNLGRVAGAGIPGHLHWHVVPRWGGDTNFMPVVGGTRVLPQLLGETFEVLAPRFNTEEP